MPDEHSPRRCSSNGPMVAPYLRCSASILSVCFSFIAASLERYVLAVVARRLVNHGHLLLGRMGRLWLLRSALHGLLVRLRLLRRGVLVGRHILLGLLIGLWLPILAAVL